DHLFRREAGRMVATLTRIFGVHNLALAEDVVQDAFCRALEVWKFRGVPENPSAWLMATAKNRALDILRRDRTARTFAPELARLRSKSAYRAERKCSPDQKDCSTSRESRTSPRAFQRSNAHCICSSTRATMEPPLSLWCAQNSAGKPCVSPRSFSHIRSGVRR